MDTHRFQDKKYVLTDFYHEVSTVCPQCGRKATATVTPELKKARHTCAGCGYRKEVSTQIPTLNGGVYELIQAAHAYFDASLWFSAPFKNEVFWAYNPEHLTYLENYISAKIREHKDREHFTLLEKLPKFYHEAKNREALLKLIKKLRQKE
jgi:transcription elongation factor Elf1